MQIFVVVVFVSVGIANVYKTRFESTKSAGADEKSRMNIFELTVSLQLS